MNEELEVYALMCTDPEGTNWIWAIFSSVEKAEQQISKLVTSSDYEENSSTYKIIPCVVDESFDD